jgi:hypothetical protein
VRQFAYGGSSAEEYIFSMLRYAAQHMGAYYIHDDRQLEYAILEEILSRLGMPEYIAMPKPEFVQPMSVEEEEKLRPADKAN